MKFFTTTLLCALTCILCEATGKESLPVVPQPQNMKTGKNTFEFTSISIRNPGRFTKAQKALREELILQDIPESTTEKNSLCVELLSDPKLKQEEYRLRTIPGKAEITASGESGALNGVWTLRQLVERKGTKLFMPEVSVHDFPNIRTRAIMFPSGLNSTPGSQETIQIFKKYIRTLAAMKYNAILIRPDRFTLWDSHKFPSRVTPITKQHWKELVDYASGYEMKIIPAFQALSHTNWLADNEKEMQEIMEVSPTKKRKRGTVNWCSSNPTARERLDKILEETIELFQPEYVHMGFDEILLAPYLVCGKCKGKNPSETFYQEIMHYYNKLKSKNIGMIVYQDEFLPPELVKHKKDISPGASLPDRLPKDIVINIWDYSPGKTYFSNMFRYFAGKGFATAGMPYHRRNATIDLAAAMRETKRADLWITSLWGESNDQSKWLIIPSYSSTCLIGADSAWNTGPEQPLKDYDNAGGWFYNAAHGTKKASSHYTELPFTANAVYGQDWPVLENCAVLPELKQSVRNDSAAIQWGSAPRPLLIIQSGKTQTVPVNAALQSLNFIQATSNPPLYYHERPTPQIAEYEIGYQNGRKIKIPVYFRRDINPWNGMIAPTTAQGLYSGNTPEGTRIQFASFRWNNPYPALPVKEIRMTGLPVKNLSLSIAIAGITAGSEKPVSVGKTKLAEKRIKGDVIRSSEICSFQEKDKVKMEKTWNVIFGGVLKGKAKYQYTKNGIVITAHPADGDGRIILDAPLDQLPGLSRNSIIAFDHESKGDMRLNYNVYLLKGVTKTGSVSAAMLNKVFPSHYGAFEKGTFVTDLSKFVKESGSITQQDATHLRISIFIRALHGPLSLRINNLRLYHKPFENNQSSWTEIE